MVVSLSRGGGHRQVIESFFDAFARRVTGGRSRCHHPGASYGDPVFFLELEGRARVMGVWRVPPAAGTPSRWRRATSTPTTTRAAPTGPRGYARGRLDEYLRSGSPISG